MAAVQTSHPTDDEPPAKRPRCGDIADSDAQLPDGWESVVHERSGLVFYRHVDTNVCAVTRPFQLTDTQSLETHPIPANVVPRPETLPAVSDTETSVAELYAYYSALREAALAVKSESNKKKEHSAQKESAVREEPDWAILAVGKPTTALLNELCMQRYKAPPTFVFVGTADPEKPFGAMVEIDGKRFDVGCGSSKRAAKQEAATRALEEVLPHVYNRDAAGPTTADPHESSEFKKYDTVSISDERISSSTGNGATASPAQILQCYCNLHMSGQEPQLVLEDSAEGHTFCMRLGSVEIKGTARGKRHARQRAAQLMLAALHPEIQYWGSLLRLYSHAEMKRIEEKEESKSLAALEGGHDVSEPNLALLERLRGELRRLYSSRFPDQAGLPSVYGPPPGPPEHGRK